MRLIQMGFNSAGLTALIAGIVIFVGTWYFAFFQSGAVGFVQSIASLLLNGIVVGGLEWLGLILTVTGLLIMMI